MNEVVKLKSLDLLLDRDIPPQYLTYPYQNGATLLVSNYLKTRKVIKPALGIVFSSYCQSKTNIQLKNFEISSHKN